MQNNANKFNVYEKQIMQDKAFLLAKREVIQKTENIFAELSKIISSEKPYLEKLENALDLQLQGPKISKGENYLGLPYVVLDHPRYFVGNEIFTFRSLFWWGNFYSFSLFVQGNPLEKLKHFFDFHDMAQDENLYVGVGEKLWEYHLEASNYLLANNLGASGIEQIIQNRTFLKLSYVFPLSITEDEVVTVGKESFIKLVNKTKMP